MPDLALDRRKTCVITGATSGIGFEAARQLAAGGMNVVGVGRSAEKCRRAEEAIVSEFPDPEVRFIVSDLSTLGNVRNAAGAIRGGLQGGIIDRLIHNAATVSNWYIGTEDGYELQFVVNYLSAFLLTSELFPCLAKSDEARVIAVSSGSHRKTRMNWDDLMFRKRYGCLKAYKQSKLALVLFTMEMNRRAGGKHPVRALAVEPGLVDTDLGEKNTGGLVRMFWKYRRKKGISAAEAAASVVRLAAGEKSDADDVYWRLSNPVEPSDYAKREDAALRLWRASETLCGVGFL